MLLLLAACGCNAEVFNVFVCPCQFYACLSFCLSYSFIPLHPCPSPLLPHCLPASLVASFLVVCFVWWKVFCMQIIEITYYGQLAVVSSSCPASPSQPSLPSPGWHAPEQQQNLTETQSQSQASAACNKAAFKCCSQTAEAVAEAEVFFSICYFFCCCFFFFCLMCAGWVAPVRLSAISHLPSASHLAPRRLLLKASVPARAQRSDSS